MNNIWTYCNVADYTPTERSIDDSIESGMNFIKRLFRTSQKESVFKPVDNLIPFSKARLNRLVPSPDWHQALSNLDSTLLPLLEKNENLIFLISQPESENTSIIKKWAISNKVEMITPPENDEIFTNSEKWFSYFTEVQKSANKPVLILKFEKYFYNHHRGLNLIRKIFNQLKTSNSTYLIELNSFFWTYLNVNHELPDIHYIALTSQAFSADQLTFWFQHLTERSRNYRYLYRKTNDGKYLIHPDNESMKIKEEQLDSKLFRKLNSYCLGIPNIALYYWKNNLRVSPDAELLKHEEEDLGPDIMTKLMNSTIWVLPWEKFPKPEIVNKLTNDEEILLWNLILHSYLTLEEMKKIVGPTIQGVSSILVRLLKLDIIWSIPQGYKINPPFYPIIKRILDAEGYLTDPWGN
ncbi:MAG: hypothetical protein INQ03_24000 [Candidatus Heimdallarchaeota archaeon]|nr:hypothetical protein [Candidatus Heimdallarchaeota archaeon]